LTVGKSTCGPIRVDPEADVNEIQVFVSLEVLVLGPVAIIHDILHRLIDSAKGIQLLVVLLETSTDDH
jgi:hypothetical protein